VSGYQYVGDLGVTNIPSGANIGNLQISNTTITTTLGNGNITLTATGTELVQISGTSGVVVPSGNTAQRPNPALTGTLRINTALAQIEAWDGSDWISAGTAPLPVISDQQITPDGSTATFTLDYDTNQESILVSLNGVGQLPGTAYTVTGNSLAFTQAPAPADIIDIRFLSVTTTNDMIINSSGNARVVAYDTPSINIEVGGANVLVATANKVFNVSQSHSVQLPVYDVANATALSNTAVGQVIYVSNGNSGNPCLAVYSSGAWKQVSFGANITT
jgi:hypothetical protein